MGGKIRIAIPSKGRLREPSIQALGKAGMKVIGEARTYVSDTSNPKFSVVFTRAFDVPLYVQYGAAQLGITGHDVVLEREADVYELLDLGFGKCELVVAVPENSAIHRIEDIPPGAKVATEYPNLSRKYLEKHGRQVEILTVRGSAELAPKLGLTDIIVDISTTGETLRKNNLRKIASFLESSCRLVSNKIAHRTLETEITALSERLRQGGSGIQ